MYYCKLFRIKQSFIQPTPKRNLCGRYELNLCTVFKLEFQNYSQIK